MDVFATTIPGWSVTTRPMATVRSARFGKNVWLTDHAIESMAKRNVTLAEVKRLIEEGE